MLALPEMLKTLIPVKRIFKKGSSFRTHFFGKLGDLIAIILSIYLALNIESWADKREEHKRLQKYYSNIVEEIGKDTISLSEAIADAEKHIENTKKHISLINAFQPPLQDTIVTFYRGMLSSLLFYSSQMISFNAMVVSGDIKIIEDLEVKNKLIELDEVYKSLKIYEDMYLAFIQEDLTDSFTENMDLSSMKAIDPRYFNTLKYKNMVLVFYSYNNSRLDQYKIALEKARETFTIIRRETE